MKLRLGTRRSALALAQSRWVAERLARAAGVEVELVPITTRGDRTPGDLAAAGGKGLFTAELEAGLLAGDLDLAVHSLKDLPVALPAGLVLAAFPERADPRDALVSAAASSLEALPAGAVLLTGSLRRRAQLLALRPDFEVRPVRGNVDTSPWARALPLTEVVEVGDVRIYVLHDIATLDCDPPSAGFAAVIFGHSHRPHAEMRQDVLYLNPGSAGPRRFTLPIAVARLEINGSHIAHEIIELRD